MEKQKEIKNDIVQGIDIAQGNDISVIKMNHIPSKECLKKIKEKYPHIKIILPDGREM